MAHVRDYEQLNISMVFLSRDILYYHLTAHVKCTAKHFISNWSYFVKSFGVCAYKNMLYTVGWLSAVYNDFFLLFTVSCIKLVNWNLNNFCLNWLTVCLSSYAGLGICSLCVSYYCNIKILTGVIGLAKTSCIVARRRACDALFVVSICVRE